MLQRKIGVTSVRAMSHLLSRTCLVLPLVASLALVGGLRASEEGNDLRAADAQLNTAYEQALEAMPKAANQEKLREAQRAWVAFRDAEITCKAALPGATGNSLKMYQTELTDTRAKQLKVLAKEAAE